MNHKEAIWTWFIRNTSKAGQWGYRSLSEEEYGHLTTCGIDAEQSAEPEFGSKETWGDTFNPNRTINVIYSDQWVCNCGTYSSLWGRGDKKLDLAVTGEHTLSQVILEVLAIGDEADREQSTNND